MTSTCISQLDICATRVASLTSAGAPLTGAGNGYVSVAQQKLEVTVEVEEGEESTEKNGCGALMATFSEPDKIKGISFAVDYTHLDAALTEIKTGAESFSSGGNL